MKPKMDGKSKGRPNRSAVIAVISYLTWLGLVYSPGIGVMEYLQEAVVGLFIAVIIGVLCIRCIKVETPSRGVSLKGILHLGAYFFILIVEIIKANFNMARIVLSPSLPIKPGIVRIKTSLNSSVGKLFLSNSITLTPGTLTLNVIGDDMFIHWVEVKGKKREERGDRIKGAFEKHLKEVFG